MASNPRQYSEAFVDFGLSFGVASGVWMATNRYDTPDTALVDGLIMLACMLGWSWLARVVRRRFFSEEPRP